MGEALKVIGVTRHQYLHWEALLGLTPPRDAKGRVFPPEMVANLKALNELLAEAEIDLAYWLRWEDALLLLWCKGNKDLWGAPNLAADKAGYFASYTQKMAKDLAEAGVSPEEMMRWRGELKLAYPTDSRGNIVLTRDWVRYLQTVREAYANGRDMYWITYNIPTPNQVRPQLAYAGHGADL